MKTVHFLRRLACALVPLGGLMAATPAAADLVLDFDNDRPDASTLPAYITFTGALPSQFAATIVGTNRTPVVEGQSYTLSQLAAGVDVTDLRSARVFVSLGSPLHDLSPANEWAPNVNAPTIGGVANPNFLTRLDKYEITYTPATGTPGTRQYVAAGGGANLSASDFFGIPLQLQTKGGAQPTTLTWNYNDAVNTAAVFQALGALENFQTDTSSNTLGAIVAGGANGVTINTPTGHLNGVVRVISPTSTNGGTTPYPNFTNYISHIESANIQTTIAGQNGQITKGGPFQNYSFNASIPSTGANAGGVVMTGTVQFGSGPATAITITVSPTVMTSYAIYGANPAYTCTTSAGACSAVINASGVAAKAVADYFAGLNFGFIGSTEKNPNMPGTTIGKSPSYTWYGNPPVPNLQNPPPPIKPLPQSDAYAVAQPQFFTGEPGYNTYAAYLNGGSTPVTDAYGFPYTDRISSPLAPLDDNTVLTMTILPDDGETPPSGWVITVPAPTTQTFADLLVGPTPSSMLTVTGGGTAIFSAANAYSGGTTIIDGTTVEVTNSNPGISSSIGIGFLTLDNGILEAGANNLVFSNVVTLTSKGGTFDTNGNTLTWNGVISGDGELTKVGAGTLILGSTNTYAGGTLVDGGTLGLGANNALGTGPVTMQPGTTLQFEASGIALENSIVLNANPTFDTGSNADGISGAISGPGALTKIGSGTLILAGSNTYAGGTSLNEGALGILSNSALGTGALAMAPGTTLQFDADGLTLTNAIVLNADPTIDTQANTATISGVISGSGSLDKIGSGTLILTAANTYSGATDGQEGTLGLQGLARLDRHAWNRAQRSAEQGRSAGLSPTAGRRSRPARSGPTRHFTSRAKPPSPPARPSRSTSIAAGQNDKLVTAGKTTLSGGTVAVTARAEPTFPRRAILF